MFLLFKGVFVPREFSGVYPLKNSAWEPIFIWERAMFRDYVICFLGREDQLERCIWKIAL